MPFNSRPRLECLESREVPAAAAWPSESFNSVVVGQLPQAWNTWSSDGAAGFAVSAGSDRQVKSNGGSARNSRTWIETDQPANVSASVEILADSLVPAQLFVRGKHIDTARPSYYAAQVARGTRVELVRNVNGVSTSLGTVSTNAYLSGVWIDVTLIARGTTLQVRAQRQDTGEWLASDGSWHADSSSAIQVEDRAIAGRGHVGLGRAAAYSGTATFDDFRAQAAPVDVRPPSVSIGLTPLANAVSGMLRVSAEVSDSGGIDRVDFLIDGMLAARKTAPKFALEFDTRVLSNGAHEITIRAWDGSGNVREAERTFNVSNLAARAPTAPRNYSHIRVAALAYNGLTMGEYEKRLLRDSVDLVIPNARYVNQIDAASPDTPQLAYTNLSNVYLEPLTDWLNFADRKQLDRETAFYHVAEATPFAGSSPSSQPVNWLWNVGRGKSEISGLVDLTAAARDSKSGDVTLGGTGESLFLGYPDRFAELNLTFAKSAQAGWTGVLEYPTAVNRLGQPTAWKPLTISTDSTNGYRQSGRLTFTPPANWKATAVDGSDTKLFYVRIRTTAGEAAQAPIASRVLGRDYVKANGGTSGVIPAFDATADRNRDGFLNDAEYAERQSGSDARFEYESRFFFPGYGQMRFAVNPESRAVTQWAIEVQEHELKANPKFDGLFIDNSAGQIPFGSVEMVEPTETFAWNYAAMLNGVSRALSPRWVLANTSGSGEASQVVRAATATIEEFALRPLAHSWRQFDDMAATVAERLAIAPPGSTLILDTLSQGGSVTDDRTRMAALAYYYLLADPDRTMLMMWGGEEPATSWSRHWFDAIAFNVGKPTGAWSEFARGKDSAGLEYRINEREYDKALVLFKPLSYTAGQGTGGTTTATATTHTLPGTFRQLRADGTLSPPITSITLRGGEGAVLVR